jgi:hypothetical protein
MAVVLAYTSPAIGHLFPFCALLGELAARGHEIHVRTLEGTVNLRSCGRSANRISLIRHTRPGESRRRTGENRPRTAQVDSAATGTPAFRIRPRQWPGPAPDADTREAPPVALHRLRARPRSRPPPTVVPQALVAICELAANANQLPLGRHCARATAARITPGSASRYVGPCADQSSVGSVWKGHALTAL